MSRSALIVIDIQEDFFRHDTLRTKRDDIVRVINSLTTRARKASTPVIWVRTLFASDLRDAFLEARRNNVRTCVKGTAGAEILSELKREPTVHVITKKRYSAFFGTELDSVISELKIDRLILTGINTHACIRTTAIDAYQRDLEVVLVADGVASYDREHHDVSLRYMNGKVANVEPADDIVF